jgi:transposase
MMQKAKQTYTKEFKLEAVQLVQSGKKSQAQIARDLGVADSTLSHWRMELEKHGKEAFPGSGHLPPLEEENRQLKRENDILRQERDVLKKLSASSHDNRSEISIYCRLPTRVFDTGDVSSLGSVGEWLLRLARTPGQ